MPQDHIYYPQPEENSNWVDFMHIDRPAIDPRTFDVHGLRLPWRSHSRLKSKNLDLLDTVKHWRFLDEWIDTTIIMVQQGVYEDVPVDDILRSTHRHRHTDDSTDTLVEKLRDSNFSLEHVPPFPVTDRRGNEQCSLLETHNQTLRQASIFTELLDESIVESSIFGASLERQPGRGSDAETLFSDSVYLRAYRPSIWGRLVDRARQTTLDTVEACQSLGRKIVC